VQMCLTEVVKHASSLGSRFHGCDAATENAL